MKNLIIGNDLVMAVKHFTVEQSKIFYYTVYQYKKYMMHEPDADQESDFSIPLQEYRDLYKYRVSATNISDIVANMPNKLTAQDKNGKTIGFISVFEYFYYDESEDVFIMKFLPSCMDYLFDLVSHFSVLELHEFSRIKKKYAQRLYELCCRYKEQEYYSMPIDTFKAFFNVPESYSMNDITKHILKDALSELMDTTKYRISANKKKKGKRVTHIDFCITTKDKEFIHKSKVAEQEVPW